MARCQIEEEETKAQWFPCGSDVVDWERKEARPMTWMEWASIGIAMGLACLPVCRWWVRELDG